MLTRYHFLLAALKVIHENNWKRLGVLEHYHLPDFLELFQPFWLIMRRVSSYFLVVVILFGFSVSTGPCDRFPCTSSLILSLLVGAGCSVGVTVYCDEDVREVGEDEVEELVDRPGTTKGT